MQAQKNKWASPWLEAVSTDGCLAAIDALRALARHQSTWDLVEEFVCVKVLPLRADQQWFAVKDDRYKGKGLKSLEIDVDGAWAKVLGKSKIRPAGLNVIYKEVA